jgi:hypothetical protein
MTREMPIAARARCSTYSMPLDCAAIAYRKYLSDCLLIVCLAIIGGTVQASSAEESISLQLPLLAVQSEAPVVGPPPPTYPPPTTYDWFGKSGERKSYAIPAAEIIGFDFLLNRVNHHYQPGDYEVTAGTIKHNLRTSWVVDNDPFSINQFFHPYQGSMYHGFARSAGLDYWEATGYTFFGSVLWEIAGERTPPAKNDQIASGISGSFLGEPLFRMANLLLEQGDGLPHFWRELAAAGIAPSVGFNRFTFNDRFDSIFPSHDPAYYSRFQLGVTGTTQTQSGSSTELKRTEAVADYSLDYGLPGKPGYSYTRPFDYFNFQATASSANHIENVRSRGLLFGEAYHAGDNYRGIWGLYGGYDYLAPQIFRVSSTALSIGTTGQWWLSKSIALQETLLAGGGYAAASTLHGTDEQDYHYGFAPQAEVALRLIFGDRAALDVGAREYFVGGHVSNRGGHDNISRADASFTVRVHDQHAIGIKYMWSHRAATYNDLQDSIQTRATVGLYYTFLGPDHFATTEWRH